MSARHIVRSYDEELALLKANILDMGKKTQTQMERAISALQRRDLALVSAIVAEDDAVDRLQKEVDRHTIQMLAMRQPMALDLRNIVSGLKMAADLERIADYAVNMARHATELNNNSVEEPLESITRMIQMGIGMLRTVLEAYLEEDPEKAKKVWHQDQEIDEIYFDLLARLRDFMTETPWNAKALSALLLVARCCERIGDHVQNIAESIHYIFTGENYHGA